MSRGVAALALLVVLSATASAHRLDEYLQAIRVDVGPDEVRIELDLTPGVGVAPGVLAAIDVNGDKTISAIEASDHAAQVLKALNVTLDGERRLLSLSRHDFPAYADIEAGSGVIRLVATAPPARNNGNHRLVIRNDHRPDVAVYLANALLPLTPAVRITSQTRDSLQRNLAIDYVSHPPLSVRGRASWTACAVALLGLMAWRRRSGRPTFASGRFPSARLSRGCARPSRARARHASVSRGPEVPRRARRACGSNDGGRSAGTALDSRSPSSR